MDNLKEANVQTSPWGCIGCLPTLLVIWVLWNHDAVGSFLLRLVTEGCR